jgi:type IV secretory pathway VirB10-like protein
MKIIFILFLISANFASCKPAPTSPSETEIANMVQQEVSKMLTARPTPAVMATNSPIPPAPAAPLVAPVPTDDQTRAEKSNGTWLVGSEIAVGKWVSRGYANCLGFLLDKDGNSIDMQMGAEAVLYVTSKGYSVTFDNPVCKWTYLPN